MRILPMMTLTIAISAAGLSAQAGNPGAPTMETPVAAPAPAFDPPQGSVNGAYLIIGAFALMALAAAGS